MTGEKEEDKVIQPGTKPKSVPGLERLSIPGFTTLSGISQDILLSYQVFGKPLHSAPVVLVNHALTGNSNVVGSHGWWKDLVGEGKCIDTLRYTVLSFNIPGNGYDGFLIENYRDFVASDMARIFLQGLDLLGVQKLFAIIGGSLGGGIAWEMAALNPEITTHLIPVASDWKSTDWLIANCQIQEQFLVNSKNPVHDARMHAMLCYRTPQSFKERFQRSTNEELKLFNVESWLIHHGRKLQERFQLSAYKLTNQLLRTIDITRRGEEAFRKLQQSDTNIHIIGVDSDLFFSATENKDTYKQIAQARSNVTYGEIKSLHGHDAFLIEYEQMAQLLEPIFDRDSAQRRYKVLKFGGKSLANGEGIERVLETVVSKVNAGEKIAVVVSAREAATDQLLAILELAAARRDYKKEFEAFESYQRHSFKNVDLSEQFRELVQLLEGVSLLGDYSPKIRDQVLAIGELISTKLMTKLLIGKGINAVWVDSRKVFVTNDHFGDATVLEEVSKDKLLDLFSTLERDVTPVIPGFIGATRDGATTTLGRNGSNYTAALLANFLDAEELQNYTHVDGIYTADPRWVPEAKRIDRLSYEEANELANFGATILHAKTIIPLLEKNIPLRILNTFNPENEGTLISAKSNGEGIRSLSVLENEALVNLEGRGLLGKVGVDARIFRALSRRNVSVSIISQGSSERGIGLLVGAEKAEVARRALEEEFESDFESRDINTITIVKDVSVISIVGQDLSTFHKPFNALIKNQVIPLLFNNTVTGKNISLVVRKQDLHKALNVMHGQIFGIKKHINLAVFGHGNVGGTLLDQVIGARASIAKRKGIQLRVFALGNSKTLLLSKEGIGRDWKKAMEEKGKPYSLREVFDFAREHHLENLIAVDNTASQDFVAHYFDFVENGFDLVSSNKIANTLGYDYYQLLREELHRFQKQYLYETNVGAGLPLIDTIKLLHLSGENITRIKGIFSGSLSYIFNTYSERDVPFSEVVRDAVERGYTEPDPREDLSGMDVGRKLLILARELELQNEITDVQVENLIPEEMRNLSLEAFMGRLDELDPLMEERKRSLAPGQALRYIGDLFGDLQRDKGKLEVKLVAVERESSLGQVRGSDSIIEIYTDSYGQHPIVIQGAGAGAAVTARGVFGDILRIAERI
ncbi:aspartate kinase [Muriicola jejuensis]|uniref:Bifunctional aspartate kinase/homoserine dehydrogenase I n=1 Tax=Muriicola jejuensis TaxID=504488 RepID=A0A6P0U8D2_9FLAO|nr:bifunctional aspartate kinase/homoserine dehydrogenase I [Muriicola jejuensis]NER09397.1 bifunctional aspartate kinase/homoserine dehydrogenase I [Muriicola jejuensis]SMP08898.1 aspartate kinase [Muriicola jejuensis]